MVKLLRLYSEIENVELEGWIEKIIGMVEIKKYFSKILQYLEDQGRTFRKLPSKLWLVIL